MQISSRRVGLCQHCSSQPPLQQLLPLLLLLARSQQQRLCPRRCVCVCVCVCVCLVALLPCWPLIVWGAGDTLHAFTVTVCYFWRWPVEVVACCTPSCTESSLAARQAQRLLLLLLLGVTQAARPVV